MRRAARLDSNHHEVAAALERDGWTVYSWAARGGPVDLLICDECVTWIAEVKDGELCPSHRRLTEDEVKFMRGWPGLGAVLCGPLEAVAAGRDMRGGTGISARGECERYLQLTGGVAR
jgi:hypothetical protein